VELTGNERSHLTVVYT